MTKWYKVEVTHDDGTQEIVLSQHKTSLLAILQVMDYVSMGDSDSPRLKGTKFMLTRSSDSSIPCTWIRPKEGDVE